ncbi:uncharacterized protein LOC133731014 [Rosa rugosa]|uniref:uncharacterized protein LOC133731014 n=1 Tax=Rosa rugosa TaxID=74645 RepID=UPI002B401DB6|nr:uncharacterized protein LOC133731014 [Rosa rugosa]
MHGRQNVNGRGRFDGRVHGSEWQAPDRGRLKLNCDGAASDNLGRYGLGFVVRNELGAVLLAAGQIIVNLVSALISELLAIKEGLEMVKERRLSSVEVENDRLSAVQLINHKEKCFVAEGIIVEEIQTLLREVRISVIKHTSRNNNKAAHAVTNFVAREDVPSWLMSITESESL